MYQVNNAERKTLAATKDELLFVTGKDIRYFFFDTFLLGPSSLISDQVQLPEMVYNNRFVTADLDHFSKIQNGAVHVKCRLRTECGLLFLGLENNGTIVLTYSFAW